MAENEKDLMVSQGEITELDTVAKEIISYSEDDRRKSDALYKYYQELIDKGDSKGETRQALAKSLELREASVNNLIEILKLKTRLIEKKIALEMKSMGNTGYQDSKGTDTSDLIASIDGGESET